MNILVTGGAGYIGSHTVKELLRSGCGNITIVDDLSTGLSERIPECVRFIKGDFGDAKTLNDIFKNKFDAVIHLAAYKSAPESVKNPLKYYENNISKSIIFLQKCLEHNVKYFIFSSSAAVYGDVHDSPITEEFETKPTNPYGWTKLMFEQVLRDTSKTSGLKHISLRYFNAGGADSEGTLGCDHRKGEDLVSVLMTSASGDAEFRVFGTDYPTKDGSCIRDLVHVSDLSVGHVKALKALESGLESGSYNLGSEKGYSVLEILSAAEIITGIKFKVKVAPRRDGDIAVSIASSKKAQRDLNWTPNYTSIEDILESAWNWESKIEKPVK